MNPIRQLEEARQFLEEAERSAAIAVRILENAQKQKAAAAAHEQKALRGNDGKISPANSGHTASDFMLL